MHTDVNDPYAILGLDPTASDQGIRAAFRRRAKELHPDLNPDRVAEFIALKWAYDVLLDPSTRAAYDKACWSAEEQSTSSNPSRQSIPVNVRPTLRRTGVISTYSFAFAFVAAIAFLLVFVLIGSTDAPPPASAAAQIRLAHPTSEMPEEGSDPAASDQIGQQESHTFFWERQAFSKRRRSSGQVFPGH